jgi:hypothetical protein
MEFAVLTAVALALAVTSPALAEEQTTGQLDITGQQGIPPKDYVILPVPRGELREGSKRTLEDTTITNSKGQRLGTLQKVIIDSKTGKIEYAVVSMPQTKELVPVPWSDFQLDRKTGRVVLHATKDQLEPAVNPNDIQDLSPDMKELMKEVQLAREDSEPSSEGLGVTKRRSAGGPMGEPQSGGAGPSGPRALPPDEAPSYEGADKGRVEEPRTGSQMGGREAPLGPPEDASR